MDCVDCAIPLKLHPDSIRASTRKREIELNLRRPIGNEGMRVYHIDEVIAGGEQMSPGTEVFFKAITRRNVESQLRVPSCNRLGWSERQLDFDI